MNTLDFAVLPGGGCFFWLGCFHVCASVGAATGLRRFCLPLVAFFAFCRWVLFFWGEVQQRSFTGAPSAFFLLLVSCGHPVVFFCWFGAVFCCLLFLGQHGSFIVASSRTGGPADRQSTRRWSTGLPDCAGPPDYRTARRRPNPDFDGDELTYIKCSSARHVVAVVWPLYAPYIQMLP